MHDGLHDYLLAWAPAWDIDPAAGHGVQLRSRLVDRGTLGIEIAILP